VVPTDAVGFRLLRSRVPDASGFLRPLKLPRGRRAGGHREPRSLLRMPAPPRAAGPVGGALWGLLKKAPPPLKNSLISHCFAKIPWFFPVGPGLSAPFPTSALKTFGKSEEKPTRPSGGPGWPLPGGGNDPPPFQPKTPPSLLRPSKPPLQKDGSNPAARGTDPSRDPPILGGGLAFVEARNSAGLFVPTSPPKPRTRRTVDRETARRPTPPEPHRPTHRPSFFPPPPPTLPTPTRGIPPARGPRTKRKHPPGTGGLATVRCAGAVGVGFGKVVPGRAAAAGHIAQR
jgi:hypothetical protein